MDIEGLDILTAGILKQKNHFHCVVVFRQFRCNCDGIVKISCFVGNLNTFPIWICRFCQFPICVGVGKKVPPS